MKRLINKIPKGNSDTAKKIREKALKAISDNQR